MKEKMEAKEYIKIHLKRAQKYVKKIYKTP